MPREGHVPALRTRYPSLLPIEQTSDLADKVVLMVFNLSTAVPTQCQKVLMRDFLLSWNDQISIVFLKNWTIVGQGVTSM